MEDKIKEMAQPFAGAITLLETLANCGMVAFYPNNQPTPNRELCLRFAKELREVAELQKDEKPIGYLFQHEDSGRTQCVDVQQVEWGFEANNSRWFKVCPLYTQPKAATAPEQLRVLEHAINCLGWDAKLNETDYNLANQLLSQINLSAAMLEAAPSLPAAQSEATSKLDDWLAQDALAKIARDNPETTVRFAAQLLGVEPCPNCDYRKTHCRCADQTPAAQSEGEQK